jgi:hypothetical protein
MNPLPSLLVLIFLATPAAAQNGLDNLASVVTLSGTCEAFVARGADRTALCTGHVINSAHSDGRSGFTFVVGGEAIDFAGDDSAAVGDRAVLHVDTMIVARTDAAGPPRPEIIRARGECSYTNPYAGISRIDCTATTDQGEFRVRFHSDGTPPSGGPAK